MKIILPALALALVSSNFAFLTPATAAKSELHVKTNPKLAKLIDRYSIWLLENELYIRLESGLNIKQLPQIAPATVQKGVAYARSLQSELIRIDANTLSLDDQRISTD
jgi:hypothetical protein